MNETQIKMTKINFQMSLNFEKLSHSNYGCNPSTDGCELHKRYFYTLGTLWVLHDLGRSTEVSQQTQSVSHCRNTTRDNSLGWEKYSENVTLKKIRQRYKEAQTHLIINSMWFLPLGVSKANNTTYLTGVGKKHGIMSLLFSKPLPKKSGAGLTSRFVQSK